MIRPAEMMQTARHLAAVALVATALTAPGARADERSGFRLFPEVAAPPPPKPGGAPQIPAPKKRLWLAAAEFVLMEVVPWVNNRYINDQPYAYISRETVADNFHAGLTLGDDHDKFTTDQLGHPVHGALYYNAARSNGFSFWESIPFAIAGAYTWQMVFEQNAHSLNDFVTTSMNGPTIGEPFHRLALMVRDDRSRGAERVLRELGSALLDPAMAFTRLVTGDLAAIRENPENRFPARLKIYIDAGFQHIGHRTQPNENQGLLQTEVAYGDPWVRPERLPFDNFEFAVDVSTPSSAWLTRIAVRGLVWGPEIAHTPASSHLLATFLSFDYVNNDPRVFGMQAAKFGLISSWTVAPTTRLRTEALIVGAPLASLFTGHPNESTVEIGRKYGWGPAAGLAAGFRVERNGIEYLRGDYTLTWVEGTNSLSRNSTIHGVRVEGRVPLVGEFGLGGSWVWQRRLSSYDEFRTETVTSPAWTAFVTWIAK